MWKKLKVNAVVIEVMVVARWLDRVATVMMMIMRIIAMLVVPNQLRVGVRILVVLMVAIGLIRRVREEVCCSFMFFVYCIVGFGETDFMDD